MWADWFKYEYCIVDNTLFIKGVLENNPRVVGFSLPIGPMPIPRAIALVERYCHARNLPVVFSAIPEDRIVEFMTVNPGSSIEELVDWADYLYDIETLASLRGKKMNKKRNHVNRFNADFPDFVVDDINDVSLAEIQGFIQQAGQAEIDSNGDGAAVARMAAYELRQCLDTVANLRRYGYHGIALRTRAGAPIVALAIGEVVGDTLFTHIEKVDHNVQGAGEMINRLMAQRTATLYPNVLYVNREEDTGDSGLRFAKQSYHPTRLLKKFNIYQ